MRRPLTPVGALAVVALALGLSTGELRADEPPQTAAEPTSAEPTSAEPAPEANAAGVDPELEPCTLPPLADEAWLDRLQRRVYATVCGSAVWFDSFFGDERAYNERDTTHGRLRTTFLWDEADGFDVDPDLKAKFSFPRLENRLNAFFRRGNEEDIVSDRGEDFERLPELFRDTTDDEWLIGLGYTPLRSLSRRFDLDAGAKLDFPIDPFVRGRYRSSYVLDEINLVRLQQTLFWRGEDGFGVTARADLERLVSPRFLARWVNLGTLAQFSEGMEWTSGVTLYQYLGSDRAFAYRLGAHGETDAEVTLEEYGLQVLFRQRAFRPWFFVELQSGVTWPRDEPGQRREASFGLGIGAEIVFGPNLRGKGPG